MEKLYLVMYLETDDILFATDNLREAEEYSKDYPDSEVVEN